MLEPYEHVQIWWDGDPEQKALAESLGQRKFPTLVFLDQNGQPAYSSIGYKKPVPFLAECVRASDVLGVLVPDDIRQATQGMVTKGALTTKPSSLPAGADTRQPGNFRNSPVSRRTIASEPAARESGIWSPSFLSQDRSGAAAAKQEYSPIKDACFLISSGNPDKAIGILKSILEANPKNASAHYLFGVASVLCHRSAEAAEHYRQVIRLEPASQLSVRARAGLQKIGAPER